MEEYKPLRTVRIESRIDGELLLNENFKQLKLSGLSTRIFELCSGKISVKNIIDVLSREYSSIDRAVLKSYVLLTLRKLDDEKLLVFSLV